MKRNVVPVGILALAAALLLAGCSRCEHQYSEATCQTPATCSLCSETVGELGEHQYSEATCLTAATCAVCGGTTGDVAEHQYSEATCLAAATCAVCGEVTGDVADHRFSEATCAAPATCAVCGETTGEALEHQFSEATCAAPATCTACGETTGEALEHQYSEANCQEYATCTACGATSGELGNHNYEKGDCTICGEHNPRYDEVAAALSKIERYPNYLSIDVDILETEIDLYKLSPSTKRFADIVDTVSEMYDYVQKIYATSREYSELYILMRECEDVEYPTATSASSYVSQARSFRRQANYVCIAYNVIAESYGLK